MLERAVDIYGVWHPLRTPKEILEELERRKKTRGRPKKRKESDGKTYYMSKYERRAVADISKRKGPRIRYNGRTTHEYKDLIDQSRSYLALVKKNYPVQWRFILIKGRTAPVALDTKYNLNINLVQGVKCWEAYKESFAKRFMVAFEKLTKIRKLERFQVDVLGKQPKARYLKSRYDRFKKGNLIISFDSFKKIKQEIKLIEEYVNERVGVSK